MMKTALLVASLFVSSLSQTTAGTNYQQSFVETVGINVQTTQEGVDCGQVVYGALSNLQLSLQQDYKDVDTLLDALVVFVDKVKYEVSPVCRIPSGGDFERFLSSYYGDAQALKDQVEDNLDAQHYDIGSQLSDASEALMIGEDTEAGQAHGQVIRKLLGLADEQVSETQPAVGNSEAAKKKNKKTSADSSEDVFGGEVYQAYINHLTILNAANEDNDTPAETSDSSADVKEEQEPQGYVQRLMSKFQQIKRGGSGARILQEAYHMDL